MTSFINQFADKWIDAVKTHCPEGFIMYADEGGKITKTLLADKVNIDRLFVDPISHSYLKKDFPNLRRFKDYPPDTVPSAFTTSTLFDGNSLSGCSCTLNLLKYILAYQQKKTIIIGCTITMNSSTNPKQLDAFLQTLTSVDILYKKYVQCYCHVIFKSKILKRNREEYSEHQRVLKQKQNDMSRLIDHIKSLENKVTTLEQSNTSLKNKVQDLYTVINNL